MSSSLLQPALPVLAGRILRGRRLASVGLLFAAGLLYGALDLLRPTQWGLLAAAGAGGLACSLLVLALGPALAGRVPSGRLLAGLSFALALALSLVAAGTWANSADEYGYLYLADTLLRGRLWNPLPPVEGILDMIYIAAKDGKLFSQYPPGWPAFLAPFRALGLEQLAAPVVLLLLGAMLLAALRRVTGATDTARALAGMLLLSPFLLLNGAAYFNNLLAACGVIGVCWLQLRNEAAPGWRNGLGIGLAFSVVLVTRYEVFAILAVTYAADRLWYRRVRCLADAVPVALGALPIGLAFLAYNAAITGDPLRTTLAWAAPFLSLGLHGLGYEGQHSPLRAAYFTGRWLIALLQFGGGVLLLLYLVALAARARARALRFFDLLLPATVAFFTCYPDFGGFHYGPRYWLAAWPTVALTIAAALAEPGGRLRAFGRRLDAGGLLRAQAVLGIGFLIPFALFLRLSGEARQAVFRPLPEQQPAVVFVPDRLIRLGPWQQDPLLAYGFDFVRNGPDLAGPVLYAHDRDAPAGARTACGLPGMAVYRWEEPGRLARVDCGAP